MNIVNSTLLIAIGLSLLLGSQIARAQTQTATAQLVNPSNPPCPPADWLKTRQFTGDGCKKKACNAAKMTAITRLKGDVARGCETFVKAQGQCVKHGC